MKGGLIRAAPLVGLLLATTAVLALEPVVEPVEEAADVTSDADDIVVEAEPSEELTEVVTLTLVELVVVVWFPPSPHWTTVSQPPAKVSSQYDVWLHRSM
jgi:hypothetical protein